MTLSSAKPKIDYEPSRSFDQNFRNGKQPNGKSNGKTAQRSISQSFSGSSPSPATPQAWAQVPNESAQVRQAEPGSKISRSEISGNNISAASLPLPAILPDWLNHLLLTKLYSRVMVICAVSAALGFYGAYIYSQGVWNQQHDKLEKLKRSERQLSGISETLGYNLTTSIQNKPGELVREKPNQALFLPAPVTTNSAPANSQALPRTKNQVPKSAQESQAKPPLGY
jgi:hypothetical protein